MNATHIGRGLVLFGALAGAIALAFAALGTSGAGTTDGELPSNVHFEQWEVLPAGGWISGALNMQNGDYAEGDTVPLRLVIPGQVDAGAYTLSICREYENGDVRGYLSLQPYNTSRAADAGGAIGSTNGPVSGVNATINAVTEGGAQGACNAGERQTIVAITKGEGDAFVLWGGRLAAPSDPGVGSGNGAAAWPGASLHMRLLSPDKSLPIMVREAAPTPTATATSPAESTPTATSTPVEPTATATTPPEVTPTASATPTEPPEVRDRPTRTPTAVAPTSTPVSGVAAAEPSRELGVLPAQQLPGAGTGTPGGESSGLATLALVLSAASVTLLGAGLALQRR